LFLLSGIVFSGKIQETTMAEKGQSITGKELLDKINLRKAGDKDYTLGYITGVYCMYLN